MSNTTMGVEVAATKSAKKSVIINRKASEVMSLQKALGNFCKLLNNHDDSDNRVYINYTARITPDFKVDFYFFRPNSEGYGFTTTMHVGLEGKEWNGRWSGRTPIHVDVEDSRDVWALVEEFKEQIKAKYATETYNSAIELKDAIFAA